MYTVDRTSTGYRLFKKLVHCRVKAKHLLDMSHVEEFGMITTTLDDYDAELAESINDVYLSTAEIAELVGDGADVQLVSFDDSVMMYNLIREHMEWWHDRFQVILKIDPDKLARVKRDLDLLDRLSAILYPVVQAYVTKLTNPLADTGKAVMPHRPKEQHYTLDDTDLDGWAAGEKVQHVTMDQIFKPGSLKRVRTWEKQR